MASSVWRRFLITQFRHQPRIFCHAKSKCNPKMFIKTFIHGKSFRYCRQFCFYSTNTSPEETHESPDLQQKEQQTLQKLDHLLKNIKQKLPDSRMLNELMDMGDKLELSNRRNTYDVLIKALCKENYMDLASAALERMLNVGCIPQTSTFYPFISVYCENNQMDKLYTLFEMMKSRGRPPDSICYNMALRKICYRKRFAEASELLEIMANHASGCRPDSITYDLMIYAACKIGKIEGALQLLGRMKEEEIRPMYGTYSHVLNGFVRVEEFDKAHLFLIQEGGKDPSMDSSNYESLIRACSNAGREKEAYDLLMEMKGKGLELLDDQLCNEVLEKHNVD